MQSRYISKLMELAENDNRILHLIADSGTGYDEMFRRNFPNQIYNFGIAEENMVAAAAGLATTGLIPFVYTSGAFLVYRALEFIRNDICFQNLNVKIVGMGCGLSWSSLGPTHHTTEELSILRAIPNLKILSPATPYEVGACLELAYKEDGPVYIRIGMNKEQEFFDENHKVSFGVNEEIKNGKDVVIFSTGAILEEVMNASKLLKEKGIDATIVNVVSIKPFDVEGTINVSRNAKLVVSVEEHNVIGGLGSIISDSFADKGISKKILKIGLNDKFSDGYGSYADVKRRNGLDAISIAELIERKLH